MDELRVKRPIFVVGPARSGTTLLYRILCRHPHVGFVNRGLKRFPESPRLARALTRLGWYSDVPKEAKVIWNRFHDRETSDASADDVTPEIAAWYRRFVAGTVESRGASRFVAKFPPHSVRLGWLDAVFPDAIFVLALRDWRAVVSSTVVKRAKLPGPSRLHWFGVRVPEWRELAELPPDEGAARVFRAVHLELEEYRRRLGPRFVPVWYGELCDDTEDTTRRVVEACGLEWSAEFAASLPRGLESRNHKWRDTLDPTFVERMRAEDEEFFSRYEEPIPVPATGGGPTEGDQSPEDFRIRQGDTAAFESETHVGQFASGAVADEWGDRLRDIRAFVAGGDVVSSRRSGEVTYRIPDAGVVVKERPPAAPWSRSARREFTAARELLDTGIRVAEPLAYLEPKRGGAERREYLVTRLVARARQARKLVRRGRGISRRSREVLVAAGDAMGRLHAAGFVHGDLTLKNVLHTRSGELYLIDLDHVRRPGALLRTLWRIVDVRDLCVSVRRSAPGVHLEPLLDAYAARRGLSSAGLALYRMIATAFPKKGSGEHRTHARYSSPSSAATASHAP